MALLRAEVRLAELKESAAREISTARHRASADVSNAKLYSSQSFATDLLDVVRAWRGSLTHSVRSTIAAIG
jgi:molecular chaperone GrpE (heat shock protein)